MKSVRMTVSEVVEEQVIKSMSLVKHWPQLGQSLSVQDQWSHLYNLFHDELVTMLTVVNAGTNYVESPRLGGHRLVKELNEIDGPDHEDYNWDDAQLVISLEIVDQGLVSRLVQVVCNHPYLGKGAADAVDLESVAEQYLVEEMDYMVRCVERDLYFDGVRLKPDAQIILNVRTSDTRSR